MCPWSLNEENRTSNHVALVLLSLLAVDNNDIRAKRFKYTAAPLVLITNTKSTFRQRPAFLTLKPTSAHTRRTGALPYVAWRLRAAPFSLPARLAVLVCFS